MPIPASLAHLSSPAPITSLLCGPGFRLPMHTDFWTTAFADLTTVSRDFLCIDFHDRWIRGQLVNTLWDHPFEQLAEECRKRLGKRWNYSVRYLALLAYQPRRSHFLAGSLGECLDHTELRSSELLDSAYGQATTCAYDANAVFKELSVPIRVVGSSAGGGRRAYAAELAVPSGLLFTLRTPRCA